MSEGTYGGLESTIPPITVPAWMCMMTSRDPGELGIYGFRNRKDYAYDALTIANSHAIKIPTLWDLLGAGWKEIGRAGYYHSPIPPSHFQVGWLTSFLTPDRNSHSGLSRGGCRGKSIRSPAIT